MPTKINWTKEEIEFLKENRFSMTLEEISKHLNKTFNQTKTKSEKLRLIKNKIQYWTKEEEKYILDNYKNRTTKEIAIDLNRRLGSVKSKVEMMGLSKEILKRGTQTKKANDSRKPLLSKNSDAIQVQLQVEERKKVEISTKHIRRNIVSDYISDFKKMTPETAYVLGFITGDGWISRPDANYYQVMVTNKVDDAIPYMEPIFKKMAKWQASYKIDKTGTRKDQLRFTISNKVLVNFLNEDLDLKNKNKYFSQKLIDFIPEHLHQYLLRGLFDADGGVYVTHSLLSCDIASNYNFDWTNLVNLIKSHTNVDVNIKQFEMKKSQSLGSRMLITKLESSCNFLNFIYKDYPSDGMGFKRKYNKFINYLEYREHSPYYFKMTPTSELLKGV